MREWKTAQRTVLHLRVDEMETEARLSAGAAQLECQRQAFEADVQRMGAMEVRADALEVQLQQTRAQHENDHVSVAQARLESLEARAWKAEEARTRRAAEEHEMARLWEQEEAEERVAQKRMAEERVAVEAALAGERKRERETKELEAQHTVIKGKKPGGKLGEEGGKGHEAAGDDTRDAVKLAQELAQDIRDEVTGGLAVRVKPFFSSPPVMPPRLTRLWMVVVGAGARSEAAAAGSQGALLVAVGAAGVRVRGTARAQRGRARPDTEMARAELATTLAAARAARTGKPGTGGGEG